jgi:hypothetical protein
MIDFSPVKDGDKKLIDLWRDQNITIKDMRNATNESIDTLLDLLDGLDDDDVTFIPVDPDAYDPHADDDQQHEGWNLAHLICHVTASSEEGAAFSSLLARGVEDVKDRPRYETDWEDVTTVDQCVQRLEESRRMRLAYLDTWPDEPFYENYRVPKTERFHEYFGDLNAPASFLMGLWHEVGHYEQCEETKKQALAAKQNA